MKTLLFFGYHLLVLSELATLLKPVHGGGVAANPMVVCYHGTWSNYRQGQGKFVIEDIDPNLCTHVVYSFAGLDKKNYKIRLLDSWLDIDLKAMERFANLRNINPNLKVMLAVGGWNEGSKSYSEMARDPDLRKTFIDSVVHLINRFDYDGFDLDWEYPAKRGGAREDKKNFIVLLKELKKALGSKLLSIAAGVGRDKLTDSYQLPEVADHLDIINLMTYDIRGQWEKKTGHNTEFQYTKDAVEYLLKHGVPAEKMTFGGALYGRSFTTAGPATGQLGQAATGGGQPGKFTKEKGFLGYNEICLKVQSGEFQMVDDAWHPVAFGGNQFVGFDTVQSIANKMKWAKEKGLGGGMVWSVETDDFRGTCGQGKYPLLRAVKDAWMGSESELPPPLSTPEPGSIVTTTMKPYVPQPSPPGGGGAIPPSEGECVELEMVADPNNEYGYLWCVNGAHVPMACPTGTKWDGFSCNHDPDHLDSLIASSLENEV